MLKLHDFCNRALLPAVDWKSPTTGSIWPAHARAVRQVEYGKLFSRWAAAGCGSVWSTNWRRI